AVLAINGPIDTTGGDGADAVSQAALGGAGGNVTLKAGVGFDDDDSGTIRLNGLINAREGASAPNADIVALRSLDGGDVTLAAADNIDAEQNPPLVTTTGDVALAAGRPTGKNEPGKTGFIGQLTIDSSGTVTGVQPFLVTGSDEHRTDTTGDVFDDDT